MRHIETPYPVLAFLIDRPHHRFLFRRLLKDILSDLNAIP